MTKRSKQPPAKPSSAKQPSAKHPPARKKSKPDLWAHRAAREDDADRIRGAAGTFDLEARDADEATPLHVAAAEGSLAAATALLDAGARVDAVVGRDEERGRTALVLALAAGHLHVAELLVERGARRDQAGGRALRELLYSPPIAPEILLDLALVLGAHHEGRAVTVEHEADRAVRLARTLATRGGALSETLLAEVAKARRVGARGVAEQAIDEGRMDRLDHALALGAIDAEGMGALLLHAAQRGSVKALRRWKAAGGAVAAHQDVGALPAALVEGQAKAARWLLDEGANPLGGGLVGETEDPEDGRVRIVSSTLGLAARTGDLALVERLLALGCDPAAGEVRRNADWIVAAPLALAETAEVFDALLAAGAPVDAVVGLAFIERDRPDLLARAAPRLAVPKRSELLQLAVINERLRCAEVLARAGASPRGSVTTRLGDLTLLEYAVYQQDAPLVRALLERGAKTKQLRVVRAIPPDVRAALADHGVACPAPSDLYHAIMIGTASDVRAVLAAGAKPDRWKSPLPALANMRPILSTMGREPDGVEMGMALLEAGADPSLALFGAVMENRLSVARAAHAKGGNLAQLTGGRSLLQHAAEQGHTEVALWLLDQGLSLESPGSAAAGAVEHGKLDTAAALVARGAETAPIFAVMAQAPIEGWDLAAGERLLRALLAARWGDSRVDATKGQVPAATLDAWRTLVMTAAKLGSARVIDDLARGGSLADAALGLRLGRQARPLHTAIAANKRAAVIALLRAGADPAGRLLVADRDRRQPGDLVVDAIASALSDVQGKAPPGHLGLPALHYAVMLQREDMVRALLDAGVDPRLPDAHGRTAAERAPTRRLRDMVRSG